jgi:hypothetical protein
MKLFEQVPSFAKEVVEYCDRQELLPTEAICQLSSLAENESKFTPIDDQLYGLRVAPLAAPKGGDENVLAIVHGPRTRRLIVFISVIRGKFDVSDLSTTSAAKKKINLAVARLISMARLHPDTTEEKEAG